jgi:ubiquitin-protein ligase
VQASRSRLFKEFKEVQRDKKDTDIVLFPDESNIYRWTAYIKASGDSDVFNSHRSKRARCRG